MLPLPGQVAGWLLVLGGLAGCATRTHSLITVEGDATVQREATILRLAVSGQDGLVQTVERDLQSEPLPAQLTTVPRREDAQRTFQVVAEALAMDGEVVARAGVDGGYREGEQTRYTIVLSAGGVVPGAAPTVMAVPNGARTGSALPAPTAELGVHPLQPIIEWSAVDGATRYQVQFDDSCESVDDCGFNSPEVDALSSDLSFLSPPLAVETDPPVGRRYFYRVRACNEQGCGPYGRVRYLRVGQQRSDYDGDGYADLAVGARFGAPPGLFGRGRVHIYRGGVSGPREEFVRIVGDDACYFFGAVLSAGDLNGDGFGDLVVGESAWVPDPSVDCDTGRAERSGRVRIFLGPPTDWASGPDLELRPAEPGTSDRFGAALAMDDLDGDGFDELAIGSPGRGARGEVWIYRGSSLGPSERTVIEGLPPSEDFGSALATADRDGDGVVEVIVGAPRGRDGQGIVVELSRQTDGRFEETLVENVRPEVGSFGRSVQRVGDLDGDGREDVYLGHWLDVDRGTGHLWFGADNRFETIVPSDSVAGAWAAQIGRVGGGVGDLNNDGNEEWVFGDVTFVDLHFDRDSSPVTLGRAVVAPGTFGDTFGSATVGAGDINGDGVDDLVIGVTRTHLSGCALDDMNEPVSVSDPRCRAGIVCWLGGGSDVQDRLVPGGFTCLDNPVATGAPPEDFGASIAPGGR